ncbi:MAG: zf-HC2 domain-containing protein [Myxococcota bacterium]
MDCQSVSDRIAGWVDDQLSPGERELVDDHLSRCESCRAMADAMRQMTLTPPAPPALPDGFWDRMDGTLSDEMDRVAQLPPPAPTIPRTPLLKRQLTISVPALMALAAAVLLSISFGVYGQLKSAEAERMLTQTIQHHERLQRLHATPAPAIEQQDYSVARRVSEAPTPTHGAL